MYKEISKDQKETKIWIWNDRRRSNHMDLRYNDIYLKGLAEGKKEAKERWTNQIIANCLKLDLSLEVTASIADVSVEEVKQVIKDNHLDEK